MVSKEKDLKSGFELLENDRSKLKTELERISGLSREEATEKLKKEIDEDLRGYEAQKICRSSRWRRGGRQCETTDRKSVV